MKIRLVLLDRDPNYLNRLSSALGSRDDCSIEIYSYTDPEQALSFLEKLGSCVFIASDKFDISPETIPEGVCHVWFTENSAAVEHNGRTAICKYQKAEAIFREILSVYAGNSSGAECDKRGEGAGSDTKVYGFFSCGGGSGASTAAAACAVRFASSGKKTLYLNLERFGTSEIFFPSESRVRIGDLIYAIKSKRSNLALKLKSAVMTSGEGVRFIGSCKAAPEVMEIEEEDIRMLLGQLKMTGEFDYIIVDADLLLEGAELELMRQATANILVSNGEHIANEKLDRIYAAMDIIAVRDDIPFPPTWILYNRFSSKSGTASKNTGFAVLGGAPRYEGGSPGHIVKRLSEMAFYDALL